GAHRIRAVPADAGTIELAENRFETRTQLDELDVTGQLRRRVHVCNAPSARHAGEKYEFMAPRLIVRHVPVKISRGPAPVMKSVAALLDPFTVYRGLCIVGLDQ